MPLYFYSTIDGGDFADEQGTEQPDDESAIRAAVRFGGEMMRDDPGLVLSSEAFKVELLDEAKRPLAVLKVTMDRSR